MKRFLMPVLLLYGVASAAQPPAAETYRSECSECHIAYPARLLPKASWNAVMRGLDQHFGVDASIDAAAARDIGAWLEANAGAGRHHEHEEHEARGEREKRAGRERRASAAPEAAPPLATATEPARRISETPWFRHEHDEIAGSTWKRTSIGSASNCEACHTRAAQGDFEEKSVRIPK